MRTFRQLNHHAGASVLGLIVLGFLSLTMTSCKSPHEEAARRMDPDIAPAYPKGDNFFYQASYEPVSAPLPVVPGAEYVNDDDICATCHGAYAKAHAQSVHHNEYCEGCHGPASRHLETQGREPGLIFSFKKGDPIVRAEACLKCHEQDQCTEGARWRTSKHAQCRVTCVDCHRGHYNVPPGTPATTAATADLPQPGKANLTAYHATMGEPPKYVSPNRRLPSLKGTSQALGAVAPQVCYRCHGDMQVYQQIAGPHQICGPNGFNCTTCHDPHGQIIEETRKDLCLKCHENHYPTMAFRSSTHDLNGVACTDCHNPHPRTEIPRVVNVGLFNHTNYSEPRRMPMSVQDPETCYKCHQKIYALNALPSHHPIKEGRMFCSDCHDPHGQREDNLKCDGVDSVNQLCYKCHGDKQGPFAYPHPPVDENCGYCHEPHGTVAIHLLKQPPNFLCLRCHIGHRQTRHGHQSGPFPGSDSPTWDRAPSFRDDMDRNPTMRQSMFTDCTVCHSQIHGSDLPSVHNASVFMR